MQDWIQEWSTDCDNTPQNAVKVYQLNRWVNEFIYADIDNRSKTIFYKYIYSWR